jgi:hypothetical protein
VTGKASAAPGIRTWFDIVLALVLVAMCSQYVVPAIQASRRREELEPVAREAHALYAALMKYRERNGSFPDAHSDPPFEPGTFEPLRRRGYYSGKLADYVEGGHIDAFDAPDDREPNHEFWMEMTLASDPNDRILIASSDDAPLGRGTWLDGVFLVHGGRMEAL